MKKNYSILLIKILYLLLFLLLELTIYFSYMIDDWIKPILDNNSLVKYESIILVNIFIITSFIVQIVKEKGEAYSFKSRLDTIFVIIALMFTLLSDTFLLYLGKYYEIGVSTFIITQTMYYLRLIFSTNFTKKRIIISSIIRFGSFIICLIIMPFIDLFNFLNIITIFYFINLVMNFVDSLISTILLRKDKTRFITSLIFTVGLLLFIGCDINVGLSNLIGKGSNLIWSFYLPSQILIALSASKMYNFRLNEVALYEEKQ